MPVLWILSQSGQTKFRIRARLTIVSTNTSGQTKFKIRARLTIVSTNTNCTISFVVFLTELCKIIS